MRSKRTDITQAGIIMCKHTASHQHSLAQSQGLLGPTRTERSSHKVSVPRGTQPCGGQAISSSPGCNLWAKVATNEKEAMEDCGVGEGFQDLPVGKSAKK